ncbi:MAG: hypothetical protein IJ763_07965 [Lachnospiraceae bacterium]|nr:hypothetical protein [Lachnospiraceae bacterium]
MRKKKFERLLLKNTMSIALPAILVLAVFIFMLMRYPVWERTRSTSLDPSDDLYAQVDHIYKSGNINVVLDAEHLTYAGFDYYVNGEVKGAYYYQLNQDRIMFYIIETKNPEMMLDKNRVRARIIKDKVSTEYILTQLMTDAGFDGKFMDDYYSEYIISECDYPKNYITMLYIMLAAPIVIGVCIVIYTMIVWLAPAIHGQARQLRNYGDVHSIIEELNLQMQNHMVYKLNNIYITEDYLIVSYLVRTDVIKLDQIKELEKTEIEKHSFMNKQKLYRLTFYNKNKTEYEIKLYNEEILNDIIDYISVMC